MIIQFYAPVTVEEEREVGKFNGQVKSELDTSHKIHSL